MLAEERRRQILEIVNRQASSPVPVRELAGRFGVTEMTIRRDLSILEQTARLRRVHGGVVAQPSELSWPPYAERRKEFIREKQQIGYLAAGLVSDGEQIMLDAGTTTLQIARHLEGRRGLTVVTNSMPIAELLSHTLDGRLILLGGEIRMDEGCVIGSLAAQQAAQFTCDRAFLGASGFSLEQGATDTLLPEAEVKQAMVRSAREAILVADSSKWNVQKFIRFAGLEAFHKIITDDRFDPAARGRLRDMGIEVITPNPPDPSGGPPL